MARPRTVSDEEILAATARVVARLGPFQFTLADVAREVGVTASAIAQRFGTKRALLLAVAREGSGTVRDRLTRARRTEKSPTRALLAALTDEGAFRTQEDVARGLAFLELDVRDPEFRALAAKYFEALREGIESLLRDAVRAGELRRCDVPALARAVEVAYNGSVITWAIRGEGTSKAALRGDVARVLAPYRSARARVRVASTRRGS